MNYGTKTVGAWVGGRAGAQVGKIAEMRRSQTAPANFQPDLTLFYLQYILFQGVPVSPSPPMGQEDENISKFIHS